MTRFWVISEPDLWVMLRRVAAGERPEVVVFEHYANADRQEYGEKDKAPVRHDA